MSQAGVIETGGSSGMGFVETLTGNTGGPIPPDINHNININTGFSNVNGTALFAGSGNTLTLNASQGSNTGWGTYSLVSLTTGGYNTAFGAYTLASTTNATGCTAVGFNALNALTASSVVGDTAVGSGALGVWPGAANSASTAVGINALDLVSSGLGNNTALGSYAGEYLTSGSYNTFIGWVAGENYTSSESSNIIIANAGVTAESHVTRIGTQGSGLGQQTSCYIAGIAGVTGTSSAVVVGLNTSSGQLLQTTITAGSGITVTPGAGTITVASSGGGFTWHDVTGGSATLAAQNGYKADSASLTTFTLPTNNALGDTIIIMGSGSGGWKIVYTTNQYIQFGSSATTTTTGNLASSNRYDCVTLICITASASAPIFQVVSSVGNLAVT